MAETHTMTMNNVSKQDDDIAVSQVEQSTVSPVVKVDSYRDNHHINLTWRSWMVVL